MELEGAAFARVEEEVAGGGDDMGTLVVERDESIFWATRGTLLSFIRDIKVIRMMARRIGINSVFFIVHGQLVPVFRDATLDY